MSRYMCPPCSALSSLPSLHSYPLGCFSPHADFGKYCTVSKSTIVRDQLTGESKGFGFIETPNMDEASKGLTGVHLTVLDGKVLSVEYAKVPDGSQPPPPRGPLGAGGARQYT